MRKTITHRAKRSSLLPTAVVLALGAGFATVGHADTTLQTTTATARAVEDVAATELREGLREDAREAAWRTRIRVATELSGRLNGQDRPLRVAARNQSSRG